MNTPTVGFAGLTHLGLNMAAATAARGFKVVGYHGDPGLIEDLKNNNLPVEEDGLADLVASHADRLSFTSDAIGLQACDIVYISIDVPTDSVGKSDLRFVTAMISETVAGVRDDALLVVLGQVPPGFTRTVERNFDKLFYQVETLIFGQAVDRAMNPERFIVGCHNPQAPLDLRLKTYLEAFKCPILPMRYESAELAKIAINACLVASISAANTLAEICENIGADWAEIVPALRLDKRIGQFSYIEPGLGLSGGNLERDVATILALANEHNTDSGVAQAWAKNSQHRKHWCFRVLEREVLANNANAAVGILGLAYKAGTHSTKNSPALALLKELDPTKVTAHDPVVDVSDAWPGLTAAADPMAACDGADALVIATPWREYKNLAPIDLKRRMNGRCIIDPYHVLPGDQTAAAQLDHFTLGRPPLFSEKG